MIGREREWTNRQDLIDFIEMNKYCTKTPATLNFKEYPVQVDYAPSVGLFLKATQPILAGEIVLIEAPITLGLHDKYSELYCGFCANAITNEVVIAWRQERVNDASSILCSRCNQNEFVRQVNNLVLAMKVKFIGDSDVGLYRMLVRLLFGYSHARRELDSTEVVVPSCFESMFLLAYQPLSTLKSHNNDNAEILSDLESIADKLHSISKDLIPYSKAQILQIFEIVICNQHIIHDKTEIGRGLYPFAALMNHSCDFNCSWESTSGTKSLITIRAIRNIDADEILSITYIPPVALKLVDTPKEIQFKDFGDFGDLATVKRLKEIYRQRGFACQCSKCISKCWACGKMAKSNCAKCRTVYYCCKMCQASDWKSHKLECKILCVDQLSLNINL